MVKKFVVLGVILTMLVAAISSAALAQMEPVGYVGYITSISGNSVLVEEDPQDPVFGGAGSNKGSFTVTAETEILRLVGGDAVTPAAFEELAVGQLVSANYSGPVLESYPTQGGAGSIVILADVGEEPLCNIAGGCSAGSDSLPEEGAGATQYEAA